jgi:putative hemolysin/spore germination protein GerM
MVVIALLLVAAGMFICRFLSGNEDTWLCENGQWVKHGHPSDEMPAKACDGQKSDAVKDAGAQNNNTGLANPASVNCVEKGGVVEMKTDESGGQYGMCVFADGEQCEEWAMFRGECTIGGTVSTDTTLTKPAVGEKIKSPQVVEGTMPGNWYFEATARVVLLDANNKVIATAPATAQGEWMTTSSVRFKATLTFDAPATATGTLILKNDNPSGLPENDLTEAYSVSFVQAQKTVKVYFSNKKMNPDMLDCSLVYPADRKIADSSNVAELALNELLKGPTDSEKSQQYFTSINDGVKLQKVIIKDGTAYVDFSSRIEYQLGGSCRVGAIRAQIEQTLKQFSTVKKVVISVDGRTGDVLQP